MRDIFYMFKKKEKKQLVGATAKRMAAYQAARERKGEIEATSGGRKDLVVPIVTIYAIACAFAFLLTENGNYLFFSGVLTGNIFLDQIIVGPGLFIVMGDPLMDSIITALLRGLFLFLCAGIPSFLIRTYVRATNKLQSNLYVLHWGCLIVTPFIYYLCVNMIFPLLGEVYDVFFG